VRPRSAARVVPGCAGPARTLKPQPLRGMMPLAARPPRGRVDRTRVIGPRSPS
jgi:hypothetical protein